MSAEPEDLESSGTKLLASWQTEPVKNRVDIAPDVKVGDAVYLNGETGRYERVIEGESQHGIYDGHNIKMAIGPVPFWHSLLDGSFIIDHESIPGED